jgi:predicted PolB exonuclease-like 3'-5' exonuclease
MFKSIQDAVWAFDCEWAPDPKAGRLLYHLPDDMPDLEVVGEMWRRGGATEEEPTPFLKTALCRVLSIAAIKRERKGGEITLSLSRLPRDVDDPAQQSETSIIGTFLSAVGRSRPQLVGYNSHTADLKILVQRGVINGLSAPKFCARPDKPWEGADYFGRGSEYNLDLLDTLGSWGKGGVSLNEIATLSGIPGKMDTSGEQVPVLWMAGRWREIVEYNCYDALTTYLVWLRMALFAGHLTREQVDEEQELLRHSMMEWMEQPENGFLEKYVLEWDRLQAATGQIG